MEILSDGDLICRSGGVESVLGVDRERPTLKFSTSRLGGRVLQVYSCSKSGMESYGNGGGRVEDGNDLWIMWKIWCGSINI